MFVKKSSRLIHLIYNFYKQCKNKRWAHAWISMCYQQGNTTLLVTPSQTTAIQCTEVSTEFSDKPPDGEVSKFFADAYHLALYTAGIKSRLLMKYVSYKLAVTVTSLLEATNVISMSSWHAPTILSSLLSLFSIKFYDDTRQYKCPYLFDTKIWLFI